MGLFGKGLKPFSWRTIKNKNSSGSGYGIVFCLNISHPFESVSNSNVLSVMGVENNVGKGENAGYHKALS